MRKLRWEVENFRYVNPCCDAFIRVPKRFQHRRDADEFMDREQDRHRLFLGACLWLILPGGRRVCKRFFDGGDEMRRYLEDLREGRLFPWQRAR